MRKSPAPELPALIAERTGGRANLIGIVCAEILADLPPGERIIGPEPVEAALAGTAVRTALGGWGMLGGPEAERSNRLDRIIVYATVGDGPFRLAEVQQRLHRLEAPYAADEIEQALVRLELAYIVARGTDGAYGYRVPLFVDMLREQDLDLTLEQELRPGA